MSEDTKQQKRDAAPEGFDTNIGRHLGDGWVIKAEGAVVQGRLLGRFIGTQKDDDGVYQAFYQFKLAVPCKATKKEKGSQEVTEVMLQPGQILNVGEHKALEELSPYCRDGGIYDVWFRYGKQEKVAGTRRTFWTVEGPKLKVIKTRQHAPIAAEVKRGEANPSGEDSDVPFE